MKDSLIIIRRNKTPKSVTAKKHQNEWINKDLSQCQVKQMEMDEIVSVIRIKSRRSSKLKLISLFFCGYENEIDYFILSLLSVANFRPDNRHKIHGLVFHSTTIYA